MPKDEFDIGDPLELNGAVVPCGGDNDEAMATAEYREGIAAFRERRPPRFG